MREKSFENKIKDFLDEQGCYYVKIHGDRFSKVGVPDLLICCNGFFIGCEVKAPNGKPSALQLYNIDEIKKSGGFAILLYPVDFERFKKLILFLKTYEPIEKEVVW